jgi:DNA adenine methylase
MDDTAHRELARTLANCAAKVAVSGYRCDLMDELYRGWARADAQPKHCHSIKKMRREALWMNY